MKALFIDVIDKLQAGLARANEKKDCLRASQVEWCVLMKSIFRSPNDDLNQGTVFVLL